MSETKTPRTGRRPGASATREAILEAAGRLFSERGYEGATMRAIAAEAGVDAALVVHFFGNKAALLVEAVQWPFDPEVEMPKLLADGRRNVGRRLVALFVETWDEQGSRNPILTLLRAATTEPEAARLLGEFVGLRLFAPLLDRLGVDQPALEGRPGLGPAHRPRHGTLRVALRAARLGRARRCGRLDRAVAAALPDRQVGLIEGSPDERPPTAAAVHARDRAAEGPGRRGRLEHPRPRAGLARLHRGLRLAQPRPFITGRAEIVEFLTAKWERELDYALRKELWALRRQPDRRPLPVREPRRDGHWWRSYGNELWEFDEHGLMSRREASINDVPIDEGERRIFGPRPTEEHGQDIPLQ